MGWPPKLFAACLVALAACNSTSLVTKDSATAGDGDVARHDSGPDADAAVDFADGAPVTDTLPPDSWAVSCTGNWIDFGNSVLGTATVKFEGATALLVRDRCDASGITWAIRENDGRALGEVTLVPDPHGVTMTLSVSELGTYQYGIVISADSISLMDAAQTRVTEGSATGWRYYPYDYKAVVTGKSYAAPDLMLPGVKANDTYVAARTTGLTAVKYLWYANKDIPRVIFYGHAEQNEGWDTAAAQHVLRPGDTARFGLDLAPAYEALLDLRHGTPRPSDGKMVQILFNNWPKVPNMTADQYRLIAARLAGRFDTIQVRTLHPESWVPPIFQAHGMKVVLYVFWAAARGCGPASSLVPCDAAISDSWLLRDADGALYRGGTGSWLMLDVRQQAARDYFVSGVVGAIKSGFDGVFLDGPFYWVADDGRVGGSSTIEGLSWARGRYLLLRELRRAMAAQQPEARIGMLAPKGYTDHIHANDYLIKEGLNFSWIYDTNGQLHEDPYDRTTIHGPLLSEAWLRETFPLIKNTLIAGSKGANPLLTNSSVHWAFPQGVPGGPYFDIGNFWTGGSGHGDFTEAWSEAVGSVVEHDGTYIAEIVPESSALKALGPSRIQVTTVRPSETPVATTAIFNRDVVLFRESDEAVLASAQRRYTFAPGQTYRVAERQGQDGWTWTHHGFAHRSLDCYAWGDVRLLASPTSASGDVSLMLRGIGEGDLHARTAQRPTAVYLRKTGETDWVRQDGDWSYDDVTGTLIYPDVPDDATQELRLAGACP